MKKILIETKYIKLLLAIFIILLTGCHTGLRVMNDENKFITASDKKLLEIDFIPEYRLVEEDIMEISFNYKKITKNNNQEIFNHVLEVGNTIEVTFGLDSNSIKDYKLSVGDNIKINFFERSKFNVERRIRPDGKISMPRIDDILVKDMTTTKLASIVKKKYEKIILAPIVSVNLVSNDEKRISKLNRTVTIMQDGNIYLPILGNIKAAGLNALKLQGIVSKKASTLYVNPIYASITVLDSSYNSFNKVQIAKVGSDGSLSIPLIGKVKAEGLTTKEITEKVSKKAEETYFNPVNVNLQLTSSQANKVFIGGEVALPGIYDISSGTTMLQAIFRARGIKDTGALSSVILIRKGPFDKPIVIKTNLKEVIYKNKLGQDITLHPFDIIYVPTTFIADANKFVDQYINKLIPFNKSFGMAYSYSLNPTNLR